MCELRFLLRMFCVMSLKVSSRKPPTFQKSLSIFQSMQEGILTIGFLCRSSTDIYPAKCQELGQKMCELTQLGYSPREDGDFHELPRI